jgi:hypothetical protein
MPNCFIDASTLVTDAQFGLRVQVAAVKVAGRVLEESGNTPYHVKRVNWAIRMLKDVVPQARIVSFVISSVSVICADCEDKVLEQTIFNSVNKLAGAFEPAYDKATVAQPFTHETPKQLIPATSKPLVDDNVETDPILNKRTIIDRVLGRNKESK